MDAPIPIKVLSHSATYSVITTDRYGNKTSVNTPLTRVRFEPVKQTAFTSLGEAKDDKFLMFFDCRNSRPKGQTFKQLDKITFKGNELTIRQVTQEYDDDTLHHYEVTLN